MSAFLNQPTTYKGNFQERSDEPVRHFLPAAPTKAVVFFKLPFFQPICGQDEIINYVIRGNCHAMASTFPSIRKERLMGSLYFLFLSFNRIQERNHVFLFSIFSFFPTIYAQGNLYFHPSRGLVVNRYRQEWFLRCNKIE